ncbi:LGFP repeat-containing protein [Geodermatophilus sp. SYSU D00758]
MRRLLRLVVGAVVAAAAVAVPVATPVPADTARAADLRYFDPGNIISDAVFWDALAMDAPAIQAFLEAKGARCVRGTDGSPCLKDHVQDTVDRAADDLCDGYRGAARESAATIIAKVARSCSTNPRVLLVLLQKEQSLVSGTNPSATRYQKATGFACPDTAPCDLLYAGFVNQLYSAARQYQRYAAQPTSYGYRAGRVNSILYHPNSGCGRSDVYIVNQATAGLYNYTPYRPNQAALAAGYGTGDPCSSYGNRNFWNYFTDWFGSTQSVGGSAIWTRYTSSGGATGPLGEVSSALVCGLLRGGCYQRFAGGSVYWSPGSGAWIVPAGPFGDRYRALGYEGAGVGYPLMDVTCGLVGGGCYQIHQGAALYAATAGGPAWMVRGDIRKRWVRTGSENGPLGYPTADEACGMRGGGCLSTFQHGVVVWTAQSGARVVSGEIAERWRLLRREAGLGYPLHDTICGLAGGGCYQQFERGSIYWSPATGAHPVYGGIRTAWQAAGAEWGALGYPLGGETCGLPSGGCRQEFSGGTISWTGSRALVLRGPIRDRWRTLGAEGGLLGYPRTYTLCGLADGGCYQVFDGGSVYWTAKTGAQVVRGGIRTAWAAAGSEWGALGYPTGEEVYGLPGGGSSQSFVRGTVLWSPTTGAQPVTAPFLEAWTAAGGVSGPLGYPLEPARTVDGGLRQRFQGGTLTYARASGEVTGP